jgi:hypothetical protein
VAFVPLLFSLGDEKETPPTLLRSRDGSINRPGSSRLLWPRATYGAGPLGNLSEFICRFNRLQQTYVADSRVHPT